MISNNGSTVMQKKKIICIKLQTYQNTNSEGSRSKHLCLHFIRVIGLKALKKINKNEGFVACFFFLKKKRRVKCKQIHSLSVISFGAIKHV